MITFISSLLEAMGLDSTLALVATRGILVVAALLLAWIADAIAKNVILRLLANVTKRTKTRWDDVIVEQGVLKRLAHYAPALVLYFLLPAIFPEVTNLLFFVQRLILVYMIGITILVIDSLLNAVNTIYQTFEISKSRPIKSYVQVVKIVLYAIGLALMVTTMLNQSPLGLLSGIGALSAVIMLVFRDSILGLVSSIQLSANNLIQIGDWIEVPQYGADGDVVDITLQAVKVQNFDKTIVTFPIYALTTSSFKNWRGMAESGGRRIKRSVNLDMNSIRFLTDEELDHLEGFGLISDYLKEKRAEIADYNAQYPDGGKMNGRRLTNVGTFRAYVAAYLKAHPQIHDEMTFLVRQLPPGPNGLGIEIYVFSKNQIWAIYEGIQADIFDHLLAVVPEFGLSVYQNPGSHDFTRMAARLGAGG